MAGRQVESGPDSGGAAVAVARDEPAGVVAVLQREQGEAEALDGGEGLQPEELLLAGAREPLRAPVALPLPGEGGAAGDAQEGELVLEVVAKELAWSCRNESPVAAAAV
jgi:hypothetical protein